MIEEKTAIDEFFENPYMDELSNPFGTEEERKKRNKEANIAACGCRFSYVLMPDGTYKCIVIKCKYYRDCPECRLEKFQKEVEPRLNHAQNYMELGDRPRHDVITEKQRGAYFKKLSRSGHQYYCFPQPDDKLIVVHNNPDGPGDELWDFGYDDHDVYNEDNGLDLNFFAILRDVPEGKKISGNLGKKQEEEPEGDGQAQEEEEETYSVKCPFIYKTGLTERDAHIAYKLALANTLDINVLDVDDLEKAWFARIDAMTKHIKDAITGFTWTSVTASEIKLWNANPNNFSKKEDVQITTSNGDIRSSNLDKKTSHFDAVISRSKRDDSLDDMRQEAIQDFLYHHGT